MHYRRARREREAGRGEFEACYTNVVFLHGKSKVGPTSSDVCEGHFFFFHIKEVTDKPHNHQQLCSSRAVFASLSQLPPCCFQQQQAAVSGEKNPEKVIVRDLLCTKQQTASQHQSAPGRRSLVCVVSSSTVVSRTPEKSYSVSQTQCVKCSMPEYQDVLLHPAAFCSMFMTLNCRWRAGSQYKSNALQ